MTVEVKSNGSVVVGLTRLTFDYGYSKLVIFEDGSGRVMHSQDIKRDPIKTVRVIGNMGGEFQPQFPTMGYDLQDDAIKVMGNIEHSALHLWLGCAHGNATIRAQGSTRQTRANTIVILNATYGIDEHTLEETFVTNIQLIANGIQPDDERNAELEVSCAWLGLNPIAITSALAFVAYLRAEIRRTFPPRGK